MIFAQIEYINLLPFYVFSKRYIKDNQIKDVMRYKKTYPANINKDFLKRKVDAGFISSIKSQKAYRLDTGIVAQGEVLSVLVLKDSVYKEDFESSTSNVLAKILGFDNEVIIGNKALKAYIENKDKYIDLAQVWSEKYKLPFVFGVLCANAHKKYLKKLSSEFVKVEVKIPYYILKSYVVQTGVSAKDILYYLTKISYKIGYKEKKSLKKFFILSKRVKNVI